ncbi:oligosaccharide flippase family protein [Desulfocastanea catecholica]
MKTQTLINRFRQNRFFCAVMTLASASAAGQLIMLVALPVLTRLYAPEAFGVLAVFSALMGVVLVVSSLRYELAIPLPRNDRNASQLLILALFINLISAGITAFAVLLLRYKIAEWTETPAVVNMLWLLPAAIITAGSYKALNFWAVRNRDYKRIARTRMEQSIANVLVQIAGGVAGIGSLGLVLGQVVGQSIGVSRLSKGIGLGWFWHRTRRSSLRSCLLLNEHNRFPKYDVPAAGINAVSAQLPNFVLAALFNPAVAGFYYLAERVLQTPMSMIGQAVAQVLYGQSRENIQSGDLHRTVLRVAWVLAFIAVVPTILIFLFAEPAFVLIFGEAWRDAGIYSAWLIVGMAAQFIYSPLSMVLMATEGQFVNLVIHSLILVLKLGALLVGYFAENALLGIQALALSLLIGYGIGIFLVIRRTGATGKGEFL